MNWIGLSGVEVTLPSSIVSYPGKTDPRTISIMHQLSLTGMYIAYLIFWEKNPKYKHMFEAQKKISIVTTYIYCLQTYILILFFTSS